MYGFIHCCLEDMVCELFGEQAWREILKISGLKLRGASFLMHQVYDDEMTFKLVGAASRISGWPVDICLEEFGKHFLVYCQKNGYDQILRVLGSNLFDFLTNLDNLHDHLASIYPGMRAPSFRVTRQLDEVLKQKLRDDANNELTTTTGLITKRVGQKPADEQQHHEQQISGAELSNQTMYLHYYSERPGLSPIVKGLVMAVAREFFQTEIAVNEVNGNGQLISELERGQQEVANLEDKMQACSLHDKSQACLELTTEEPAGTSAATLALAGPDERRSKLQEAAAAGDDSSSVLSSAVKKHLALRSDNHVILKIDKIADINDPLDEVFPSTSTTSLQMVSNSDQTTNNVEDLKSVQTPANSRSSSLTASALASATLAAIGSSAAINTNNNTNLAPSSARNSGAGLESRRGSRITNNTDQAASNQLVPVAGSGVAEPSLLDRTSMLNIYKSLSSKEVDSLMGKSLLSVTSEFWKRRAELVVADDAIKAASKQGTFDMLSASSTMTNLQEETSTATSSIAAAAAKLRTSTSCTIKGSLKGMAGSLIKEQSTSSEQLNQATNSAEPAGSDEQESSKLVKFGDMFQIDRPKIELNFEAIASHTNQVFVVKSRASVLNTELLKNEDDLLKKRPARNRSRSSGFRSLRKSVANYRLDDDSNEYDSSTSFGSNSLQSSLAHSPRNSFSCQATSVLAADNSSFNSADFPPFVTPMPPSAFSTPTPYPCPLHRGAVIVHQKRVDAEKREQEAKASATQLKLSTSGSFKVPSSQQLEQPADQNRRRMTVACERRGSRMSDKLLEPASGTCPIASSSTSNLSPRKHSQASDLKSQASHSQSTFAFDKDSSSRQTSFKSMRPSLRLKGQMIVLMGGELCLFLCSPRVDHLQQLAECGIHMADLSLADRTRELMLMSHTHKEDRENVKKLDQATNDMRRMETKLRKENTRTQEVLQNIFPAKIANSLAHGVKVESESFELVSCLYSDIIGFTKMCGADNVKPIHIVRLLNTLYLQFDSLSTIHGVFKVETIGDAYVVVGGLPEPLETHADRCVRMGLDMVRVIKTVCSPADGQPIQMRIGIHSGPVMAGIVGVRVPRYSLFGNTTTLANLLESQGEGNKIHISDYTASCLVNRDRFTMELNSEPKNALPFKTHFVTDYKAANSDEEIRHELLLREALAQDFEMMADTDQLELLNDQASLASNLNLYRRPSVIPANKLKSALDESSDESDDDEDDDCCESTCESDDEADEMDDNDDDDHDDDDQHENRVLSIGAPSRRRVETSASRPLTAMANCAAAVAAIAASKAESASDQPERKATPMPLETNVPQPRKSTPRHVSRLQHYQAAAEQRRNNKQLAKGGPIDIGSLVRDVLETETGVMLANASVQTNPIPADMLAHLEGCCRAQSLGQPIEAPGGRNKNNQASFAGHSFDCDCSCRQTSKSGALDASHGADNSPTDSFSEDCSISCCSQHHSYFKALNRMTRLMRGQPDRETLDLLAAQISKSILSDAIKKAALEQALGKMPAEMVAQATQDGDLKLRALDVATTPVKSNKAAMEARKKDDDSLTLTDPCMVFGLVNLVPDLNEVHKRRQFTLHLNSAAMAAMCSRSPTEPGPSSSSAMATTSDQIVDKNNRKQWDFNRDGDDSGKAALPTMALTLMNQNSIANSVSSGDIAEAKLHIRVDVANHFENDSIHDVAAASSKQPSEPRKCANCAERSHFENMLEEFRAEREQFQAVLADSELLSIGRRLLRDTALMEGLAKYAQDELRRDQMATPAVGIPLSASSALKRIKRMDTIARLRQERSPSPANRSVVINDFGLADCQPARGNDDLRQQQRPHSSIGQVRDHRAHPLDQLVIQSQPSCSSSMRASSGSLLSGQPERPLSAASSLAQARQKRIAMEQAAATRRSGFFWTLTSPLRRPLRSASPAPRTSAGATVPTISDPSPGANEDTPSCCFWRPSSASGSQPAPNRPERIVLRKNKPSHGVTKKKNKNKQPEPVTRLVKTNSLYRKPLQPRREM